MFSKTLQRRIAWLLTLIMMLNQIGTPALAVSQNIIRPGAGVSRMPLEVTNFSAPGFGEVSDAVNLANGNAYVAVEGLSRNNQLTASDETKDSIGTTATPSTGGQWQLTSRLRLGGFTKVLTTATAPANFVLYSGDASAQTFAKLTAPPVWANTPTWIQRYQSTSNVVFYNSSVQTGTQYAQTWIVLVARAASNSIAHYYDGGGARVSFYNDGEYADYAQNPYQQYWGAKNNADPEGSSATAWTASPAAGTPKTEILYDATGYGRISEVKDQWGRKTTYTWNTTDGTLLQISHLIQPDGLLARGTAFLYTTIGGQRVLSHVQYGAYSGRGTGSGNYETRTNRFFYVQQTSGRVVLQAVQRPIVGSQGRITTVYSYDNADRVTGVNTVDIGNTDYTATASLATNVEPAITYIYGTTTNAYGGKNVTVEQYENGNINSHKETQYLMNASNQLMKKRVLEDSPWLRLNSWYGAPASRWLEWTYSYTSNGSTKSVTQPSGRVEQYTYDFESAVSASNPTQAGNVVKQATFTSPTAATNNTPERSQTFAYNIDNQRTQSLTPALSGTRDGVNYKYSNVQTDTTYAYHTSTVSTQTFKPISSVTSDTKNADSGTLAIKFSNISTIDELGRVTKQERTSPTLTTKTTTYSYWDGTSYKPYMPSTDANYIQSTREAKQYGDLINASNDGQHSIGYYYDWYGNVNIENRVSALSSDQKTNGTPSGNEYRKDRVTMTGFNGFGQKTFEDIYEYDRTASFKQWFWYATGELDSSWEAANTNTTDYTYYITGANAGRVAGISKGEGSGNGGVTTPHESTTLNYDAFGRVSSTTTDGFLTNLSYDTLDRVVYTKLPNNAENPMVYSLSGTPQFECSVDPSNGLANHCQYKNVDSLGRVTAVTHSTNGAGSYYINTTFDPYDRPIRVNDNSLEMITAGEDRSSFIAYDSLGNVVKALSPVMRNAAMPTTGMQNYGAHTDSRRPYTEFTYDNLGRKTLERKILHDTVDLTTFNSMVNTRSTQTTVATSEAKTTFEYDTWDRVKNTIDPDGYATAITYDGMDNVTSQTRSVCNGLADCTSHMQNNANTAVTSMTYDARGRLTSTIDPNGVGKKVQYTLYGSVKSETDSITSSNPSGTTRKYYNYTNDGLLSSVNEPDNASGTPATFAATGSPTGYVATKSFIYGTRKFPTQSCEIGINDLTNPCTTYTYDFTRRPLTTILPADQNGANATITQTYNIRGKQTSITDANGFTTRFVYDGWDNLRKETKEARAGNTTDSGAFPNGYGAFNGVSNAGLTTVYEYDLAGNLSRKLEGGLITAYAYNSMGKVSIESKPAKPSVAIAIGTITLPEPIATAHKGKAYRLDGELVAEGGYDYGGTIFWAQLGVITASNRPTVTQGNLQAYTLSVGGKRLTEVSVSPAGVESTSNNTYNGLGLRYKRAFDGLASIYASITTSSGTILAPTYETHWNYDANGKIIKNYQKSGTETWDVFEYTYTNTGKEASQKRDVAVYIPRLGDTGAALVGFRTTGTGGLAISSSTYNERDQLLSTTVNDSTTQDVNTTNGNRSTTYAYFADGRKSTASVYNNGVGVGTQTYSYDARGRVITNNDSNGAVFNTSTLTLGNVPTRTNTNYGASGTSTDTLITTSDNKIWRSTIRTLTIGGLTAKTHSDIAGTASLQPVTNYEDTNLKYDANGSTTESRTDYTGRADQGIYNNRSIDTLSYDNYGNRSSLVNVFSDMNSPSAPPKKTETETNTYNAVNSVTSETRSTVFPGYTPPPYSVNYTLDSRGNRLGRTITGTPPTSGTELPFLNGNKRYDADGRAAEFSGIMTEVITNIEKYVSDQSGDYSSWLEKKRSQVHLKFRFDPLGQSILSFQGEVNATASTRYFQNQAVPSGTPFGAFTNSSQVGSKGFSTTTVDGDVQTISTPISNKVCTQRFVNHSDFTSYCEAWATQYSALVKDQTFSFADGLAGDSFSLLAPFSATNNPIIKLEAPTTSFSSSIGLSVSTLAAPTSPAPPSTPGSITPPTPAPPTSPAPSSTPAEPSSAPTFGVTAVNIAPTSSATTQTPAATSSNQQPEPSSIPPQEFSSSISLENPNSALPTSINTVSVSSLGIPSSVGIPDSGVSTLTPPSSGALPSSIGSVSVSSLSIPGGGLPGSVGSSPVKPGTGSSSSGDVSTFGVYDSVGRCVDSSIKPGDPGYCKTSKELSDEADRLAEAARKATGEARDRAILELARIRAILETRNAIGNDRYADLMIDRYENSALYKSVKDNPTAKTMLWLGMGEAFKSGKYREYGLSPKAYLERLVKGAEHLEFAGRDALGTPIYKEVTPKPNGSSNFAAGAPYRNGETPRDPRATVAIIVGAMVLNFPTGQSEYWYETTMFTVSGRWSKPCTLVQDFSCYSIPQSW